MDTFSTVGGEPTCIGQRGTAHCNNDVTAVFFSHHLGSLSLKAVQVHLILTKLVKKKIVSPKPVRTSAVCSAIPMPLHMVSPLTASSASQSCW